MMGIRDRIRNRVRKFLASTVSDPAQWFVDWVRGDQDDEGGVPINRKTATGYPPIWYAVNKIAGHVGQLPLAVINQNPDNPRLKKKATEHPGHRVIRRPNKLMTGIVWREIMQYHALLLGNGRSAIERDGRNGPASLIPLMPDRTMTVLVNGEKYHVTTDLETGVKTIFPDADVVHIAGLGYDGLQGYSLLDLAKNSIQLGLNAEKFGNTHFKNHAVPGLLLQAPLGAFKKEEDARKFLNDFNTYHRGVNNANRAGLLRDGITATTLAQNGRDSQWLEQRKFQRQDAALYMLLEQILGDDASVSYNSLEQKNLAYLTNCLMRWLVKWEEELNAKLLTETQFRTESHYFRFTVAGLLRGTTKERYEIYNIGRQIGMFSANMCLEFEDLPPHEGGDNFDNPAITPGPDKTDSGETDDKPPDKPPDTKRRDTAKQLIASRLKELALVEAHRIQAAAVKQKNFTAWLDEFYSEGHFVDRIVSVYGQVGGTPIQAASYAGESKAILLDIAGSCDASTFVSTIDSETSKWHARADAMADVIVNTTVTT